MKKSTKKTPAEKPLAMHFVSSLAPIVHLNGTTYRKESLKVGSWHGNTPTGKPYVVTLERLQEIAKNFAKAIANKLKVPLIWTHDDDPRNRFGDVVGVDIEGDSLYTVLTIPNPSDAERAKLSDVSVEVTPNYVDGRGNRYSEMLTHLAVVTNPAVPGLKSWEAITLSLREPVMKRWATRMVKDKFLSRQLAEGESGGDGEILTDSLPEGAEEIGSLDPVPEDAAAKIVEILSKWAEADGYKPLPEGTNGENLVANLSVWAMYNLEEAEAESEPITDDTAGEVVDETEPVEMSKKKSKAKEVIQLRTQIKELQTQLSSQRRTEFVKRADSLVESGRLTVVARNKVVQLAAKSDYDIAVLDAIGDSPNETNGSQAAGVMTQLAAKGGTKEKSYSEMNSEERKAYRTAALGR